MKRITILFPAGLWLAACTGPMPERHAPVNPPPSVPTIPAPAEARPEERQAPKQRTTGVLTAPASNPDGDEPFELPRYLIRGEFQMSFGFGIKMLRDEHTRKVMFMYVDGVDSDSDAERKGLESGARIMAIEGKPVGEFEATFNQGSELNRIFSFRNRGATVTLEVIPLGAQAGRVITIVERPMRFDQSDPLFHLKIK